MLREHPSATFLEPNPSMWTTIDRARRRLTGALASATDADQGRAPGLAAAAPGSTSRPVEDVVIILGSHGVDQLRRALERVLGDAVEKPDTPARIDHALTVYLSKAGLTGRPRVLRRPAGLSTPESWEIHLDGIDKATGRAVRAAGRTGSFSS
jgi:hypothetical protein